MVDPSIDKPGEDMHKDREVIELNKMRQEQRQDRRRKTKSKKKFGRGLLLLVVFVLAVAMFAGPFREFLRLRSAGNELDAERARLLKEKENISKNLEVIDNPSVIENEARERLHLIKKGEILYVLPEDDEGDDE